MSAFRDAVMALNGKETYLLIAGNAVKVTISKIVGDLVMVKPSAPVGQAKELAVHIDSIQLVTA